jgi:hypothetical protein
VPRLYPGVLTLSEKERGVWGPPPHVVGPCEQAIMIRCNVVRYQNRVIRLRNLEIPSTSRRLALFLGFHSIRSLLDSHTLDLYFQVSPHTMTNYAVAAHPYANPLTTMDPAGHHEPESASHTPEADDPGKKRKTTKRRKVNHACLYCRRSHMTCDEGRPCQRW